MVKTSVKVNMKMDKRMKIATSRFTGTPESLWDMVSQLLDHNK